MKKIIPLFLLIIFVSCSSDISYQYPEDPAIVRKSRSGKFFKDDVTLYGKKDQKKSEKFSDNNQNPLWTASVEVISNLMPIAIIDNKSGIIVTEWYQDEQTKDERIKISALIKGREVKEENLSISLFRQKKDAEENWKDQKLTGTLSAKLIRGKILDKAKILARK